MFNLVLTLLFSIISAALRVASVWYWMNCLRVTETIILTQFTLLISLFIKGRRVIKICTPARIYQLIQQVQDLLQILALLF